MNKEMKILVPLNDRADIKRFSEAGADQFYFGFYDEEWSRKFGDGACINRMSSFGTRANRFSFDEALCAISESVSLGRESYITFNANVYSAGQLDYLAEKLDRLKTAGVTGVILSDAELAKVANDIGIHAVASTMTAIYNTDILAYYVRKGFKRIITPRECSIEDIGLMHEQFPEIEIEAFFMRNGCIYSDSNCLIDHRFGGMCTDLRRRQGLLQLAKESTVDKTQLEESLKKYDERLYTGIACGQCALYELGEVGVTALKIVGRADRHDSILSDIETTKANLLIVAEAKNRDEYLKNMIKPKYADDNCVDGFNCYYRR